MRNKTLIAFALTSMFTVYAADNQVGGGGASSSAINLEQMISNYKAMGSLDELRIAERIAQTELSRCDQSKVALLESDTLFSTLSANDVNLNVALSKIVYEYSKGKTTQSTAQITRLSKQIELLESLVIEGDAGIIREKIEANTALFDSGDRENINNIRHAEDSALGEHIIQLHDKKKVALASATDDDLAKFKYLIEKHPTITHSYKVQGVLYRNGGEISGIVLYDSGKNELMLAMAGSQSRLDWFRNLCGWNAMSDTGLFTNMNFHAGFLGHVDEAINDGHALIKSWFVNNKSIINDSNKPKLSIRGTGHSLGGALSMMFTAAAKQIAEAAGIVVEKTGVITFGSPNMVHSGSLDEFETMLGGKGNVVNFADSWDPVPRACFWKCSPGVRIDANVGIFHDTKGEFSFLPRLNPHNIFDYFHGAARFFNADPTRVTFGAYVEAHKKVIQANKARSLILELASTESAQIEEISAEGREYLSDEVETILVEKNTELERLQTELRETLIKQRTQTLLDQVRNLRSKQASLITEVSSLTALNVKLESIRTAEQARLDAEFAAEFGESLRLTAASLERLSDETQTVVADDTASNMSTQPRALDEDFDMLPEVENGFDDIAKGADVLEVQSSGRVWYKPWTWFNRQ